MSKNIGVEWGACSPGGSYIFWHMRRQPQREMLRSGIDLAPCGLPQTQKNQRRGTSGSSVTTFIYIYWRYCAIKNNQKGRVYSLRGIRGAVSTINTFFQKEESFLLFSLLLYLLYGSQKNLYIDKTHNFFLFFDIFPNKKSKTAPCNSGLFHFFN